MIAIRNDRLSHMKFRKAIQNFENHICLSTYLKVFKQRPGITSNFSIETLIIF